jgi:hypothetical protein
VKVRFRSAQVSSSLDSNAQCVPTFLATTSSLATDLTAAGGDGIGEGALAMSDMMTILKLSRGCVVLKMIYDGEEQSLEL